MAAAPASRRVVFVTTPRGVLWRGSRTPHQPPILRRGGGAHTRAHGAAAPPASRRVVFRGKYWKATSKVGFHFLAQSRPGWLGRPVHHHPPELARGRARQAAPPRPPGARGGESAGGRRRRGELRVVHAVAPGEPPFPPPQPGDDEGCFGATASWPSASSPSSPPPTGSSSTAGPSSCFSSAFKRLAPEAAFVYRVSDDLRHSGIHPTVIQAEDEVAPRFDLVSVPCAHIAERFRGLPRGGDSAPRHRQGAVRPRLSGSVWRGRSAAGALRRAARARPGISRDGERARPRVDLPCHRAHRGSSAARQCARPRRDAVRGDDPVRQACRRGPAGSAPRTMAPKPSPTASRSSSTRTAGFLSWPRASSGPRGRMSCSTSPATDEYRERSRRSPALRSRACRHGRGSIVGRPRGSARAGRGAPENVGGFVARGHVRGTT